MLFSVIIPAKNASQTISTTLESIIKQNNVNFEVIVVDDHSNDDTRTIVLDYSNHHECISYYLSTGDGVSVARNMGIDLAHGDYLIFVDADDQLEPNALRSFSQCISYNKRTLIIFSGYKRIAEDGTLIKRFSYEYVNGYGMKILPMYLNKRTYTHLGAFCFSKEFLLEKKIRFQNYDYAEDIVFVSQALFLAETVACLEQETYCWTLRKGSVLYSNTLHKFNGLHALAYLKKFFEEQGCQEKDVHVAVGNHYAMLLLDTVTSLLWMGRTIIEINQEIDNVVNWGIIPKFIDQSKRIRKDMFFLKYFRLLYLKYCKKYYVPHNFRKKGIKSYER